MSAVYYWSLGETPTFTGTLEREVEDDVWVEEDLSNVNVVAVTVTLYRMNGSAYKTDAPVTKVGGGRVKYTGVTADAQQGELTGKFFVTYADGSKVAFPKPGRFQLRVSQ
jgi:hypothetical protein